MDHMSEKMYLVYLLCANGSHLSRHRSRSVDRPTDRSNERAISNTFSFPFERITLTFLSHTPSARRVVHAPPRIPSARTRRRPIVRSRARGRSVVVRRNQAVGRSVGRGWVGRETGRETGDDDDGGDRGRDDDRSRRVVSCRRSVSCRVRVRVRVRVPIGIIVSSFVARAGCILRDWVRNTRRARARSNERARGG